MSNELDKTEAQDEAPQVHIQEEEPFNAFMENPAWKACACFGICFVTLGIIGAIVAQFATAF
eukprot:snap_masked-scaffold_120-processed-gene-0.12-mRNA-1 protein AED:1.00 eAED:1.00 QI:0/-1/0/0/-1/1/1/0/61